MDRSQHTSSALAELRQIQHEIKRARNLDDLRFYYERVQTLRRTHADDFDLQLSLSEAQEEIVELGRRFRSESRAAEEPILVRERRAESASVPPPQTEEADERELPGVQKLDHKTWQRVTYLALFFALLLFFAFFYLLQTARRLNFPQNASNTNPATATGTGINANRPNSGSGAAESQVPTGPLVRVYTDLIPATYSLDDKEPQELKDGELTLEKLEPGRHSLKVNGKYSYAALSFDLSQNEAPRVIGQPAASNVMAVAVSTQDGKGKLISNVERPLVLVDGKPAGDSDTDGLTLDGLGKTDHDLQVTENKDRQRFVLTYTQAPSLTFYVKADPNAGTVVIMAGQDEADVYINDKLYRRRTDRGQLRIPLQVGNYTIRLHKAGFIDPPPQTVQVKKAEESALDFKLEPVPQIATLEVKGAPAGTMVYVDKELAAAIGPDGNASISNIKPGDHAIELRRDQALPKHFERTFRTGDVITLSGPDTTLEKVVVDSRQTAPAAAPADSSTEGAAAQTNTLHIEGQQVRKGGGFVAYHVPRAPGHYSFQLQARKGGLFKHAKVQWYAGYVDPENYILFTLDGKRAAVREVQDGKSTELGRVPFEFGNDDWVQVDMNVRSNSLAARIKTPNGPWQELAPVSATRDLTQDKVGVYIPGNDELAIANFRFSNH